MKTATDLLNTAAAEDAKVEALQRKINEAALKGDDIEELVNQKAAAESMADQYRRAVQSAKDAEAEQAQKAARAAQSQALGTAAKEVEAVLDAAEAVDAAMVQLEQTYEALSLKLLDLQRSLRLSGNSDGGRIATNLKPALRWSTAHFAPNFAQDAGIPRVPNARRRSLQESLDNLIPKLPEAA